MKNIVLAVEKFSFLKEEQNGQDVMVKAAIGGISVVLDLESGPVRGRSLFVVKDCFQDQILSFLVLDNSRLRST